MTRCGSCQAPIVWAIFPETSKRVPLDADEHGEAVYVPGGNIAFTGGTLDGTPLVRVAKEQPRGLRTHFQTCPNAGQHRKGRR